MPDATLRSWVAGRRCQTASGTARFRALIRPPSVDPLLLSFNNLVEAHVIRSLRTEHGVPLHAVRQALEFAERELRIDRLLLREDLRTDAGQLFLDRYGQLLNLSKSGQLAMQEMFEQHLKRVEWDPARFPIRLYPFVSAAVADEKRLVIDPSIAFGRPVVLRSGVSTRAIADHIDAGEIVNDLGADYGMDAVEIRQAVLYERAA